MSDSDSDSNLCPLRPSAPTARLKLSSDKLQGESPYQHVPRLNPPNFALSRRKNRKRSRNLDPSSSSDEAFFSSDDLDNASAKKYSTPVRRTQYKRAWYEPEDSSRVHSHEAMRSATRRPKDSGIYMNSDESNSSLDDGFSVDDLKLVATQRASKKMAAFMSSSPAEHSSVDGSVVSVAVTECLEHGKEVLDLTGKQLTTIDDTDLRPLRNHVRHPRFDPSAYTEEFLEALVPSLQLYLSTNSLRSIPGELFNLQSLTCLSLRNNQLAEVPPAIGRLSNLQELNVAGNLLRWLPWELLPLIGSGTLRRLYSRPNQLLTCRHISYTSTAISPRDAPGSQTNHSLSSLKYLGSSAAAWFEHDGVLYPFDSFPKHVIRTSVPSLFETALRACSKSPALHDLDNYLQLDTPDHVRLSIAKTQQVITDGGRQCSVCSSAYVIARAEWIEYWQYFADDGRPRGGSDLWSDTNTVPFLRRACSWQCAADADLGGDFRPATFDAGTLLRA